jgi:hypothetical protein
MTKLEKLYSIIENSKELGLQLGDDVLRQTSELEENIIKKEILPVLTETIEPALNQVRRELVLVVDYVPDEPISVRISRKRNFSAEMEDSKEILPDPQVEHNIGIIKRRGDKKAPRTNLRVKMDDGRIIEHRFALDTLKEVVQIVGIDKVRALNIIQCGVPLISNTLDNVYSSSQKDLQNGWYLMTLSSTITKKQQLDKISDAYNLGMVVEIV